VGLHTFGVFRFDCSRRDIGEM